MRMMLRIGSRGFTLLEIMVTTAVLSFGLVMIYQAFFISLDTFDYYVNSLRAQLWIDERIWQLEDDFRRLRYFAPVQTGGAVVIGNQNYTWNLDYSLFDSPYMYKVKLNLLWKQGKRKISLSRDAYLANFNLEEDG